MANLVQKKEEEGVLEVEEDLTVLTMAALYYTHLVQEEEGVLEVDHINVGHEHRGACR